MFYITYTNNYSETLELIKNSTSPRFPEYATFSKRLFSLDEFSSIMCDKLQLADAGFFFRTKDSVQCWTCGLILGNWLKGDCPFIEHVKFSNKCPFVLLNKGIKFVNKVNNRFKFKDLTYCYTNVHTHHGYDEVDGN